MTDFSPEDLAFVIKIGQIAATDSASAAPVVTPAPKADPAPTTDTTKAEA
jgi:hypothetical protein